MAFNNIPMLNADIVTGIALMLFFLMVSFLLYYLLELLISSFLSGTTGILSLMFQMLAGLAISVYMSASVSVFFLLVTGAEVRTPPQPEAESGGQGEI